MQEGIQQIIQGGAVGVALVSLWILYKINSNHIEHHERAIERFAQVIEKDSEAKATLASALEKLSDKIIQ